MVMVEYLVVHRCANLKDFIRASNSRQILFYSTKPLPARAMLREEFEEHAEYYVPCNKAMELYELICDGEKPQDIILKLGLESLALCEVERDILERRECRLDRKRRGCVLDTRADRDNFSRQDYIPTSEYPYYSSPEDLPLALHLTRPEMASFYFDFEREGSMGCGFNNEPFLTERE